MKTRKVAAVILVNSENKILIMKRSAGKKSHPNLWGLPAGGVKKNESLELAASREVLEETGLTVTDLKKGPTLPVQVEDTIHEVNYFIGKSVSNEVLLNSEHTMYKWVDTQESLKYEFGIPTSHVKKILQEFSLLP